MQHTKIVSHRGWTPFIILILLSTMTLITLVVKGHIDISWMVYTADVQYQKEFSAAIVGCDRIVIRDGGDDRGGSVDGNKVILELSASDEVNDFIKQLQVVERSTPYDGMCLCYGWPGVDFYRGKQRLALTAIQHGQALRWQGFTTRRFFGFPVGYVDAPLTPASATWIKSWMKKNIKTPYYQTWTEEGEEGKEKQAGSDDILSTFIP